MKQELEILKGGGIAELKQALPAITPTIATAVKWLNLRSLVTSKSGEELTKAMVAHLKSCKECEEVYEGDLGVKLIYKTTRVYKQTKGLKAAQAALDELLAEKEELEERIAAAKEKLEEEGNKAGFTQEKRIEDAYYKAI